MAEILVGAAAANRSSITDLGPTWVQSNGPADGTGKITSVEVWFNTAATGVQFATFIYHGSDVFSTRDYEEVGEVASGSKQTFSGLDMEVETGDYIGLYGVDGAIDRDNTGGAYWYYEGDHIPCSPLTFAGPFSPRTISLYGKGETTDKNVTANDSLKASEIAALTELHLVFDTISITEGSGVLEVLHTVLDTLVVTDIAALEALLEGTDVVTLDIALLKSSLSSDTLVMLENVSELLTIMTKGDTFAIADTLLWRVRSVIAKMLHVMVVERAQVLVYFTYQGSMFREYIYQRGEGLTVKVDYRENRALTDLTTITITIYDPMNNVIVDGVAMTHDSTGKYSYDYTPSGTAIHGRYTAEVTTTQPGEEPVIGTNYFELE